MANILVCDAQASFAQHVAKAAAQVPGAKVLYLPNLSEAMRHVRDGKAEMLVAGPTIPPEEVFVAVRTARDAGSPASVVLIVSKVTQDLLRTALRADVDDVLAASTPVPELATALADALDKARRRGGGREDTAEAGRPGTVVTVFSTKGGVGKTVVATNLAVALAHLGKSVVLVDLDLQFGDVGIVLGLEPTQTIVGAVQSGDRLDTAMLRGFLVKHSSGLQVLLAPLQPEDAEIVTASRIDRIISLLQSMFEYVVIDTPPVLDEAVLTALDRSDRILAITMMDVASIKNSRVSLQKLRQLGYNGTLVDVLLNRADSKVFLKAEEVEQAIGTGIKYRLPSDLQIPRAVNKGVPVVLDAPKSQPAKVMFDTARAIIAEREGARADVS